MSVVRVEVYTFYFLGGETESDFKSHHNGPGCTALPQDSGLILLFFFSANHSKTLVELPVSVLRADTIKNEGA